MAIDKKDIIIISLIFLLLFCIFTIFNQHEYINTLQSEIQSNREIINTELHMIDSIYDNNYRLWDYRVEELLRHFEQQGYLIKK
jgi:uncharacterized membrane protein